MTDDNGASQNKGWRVYMVRTAAGALYTGITNDIDRRFAEHQSGGPLAAKALRGKGPLTLVYIEAAADKSAALKREYAIKQLSKTAKENLVNN